MESEKNRSDLEDGEVREDVYEDISDCSLSDIVQEDFSDDSNIDSLRQEALKSLPFENENNEEEKYRLEALKSLLENTDFLNENEESLHEIEDLTEEEKYRLEAIKSLLRNTDFLENKSQKTRPTTSKKRRKRRKNKNNVISKRVKAEPSVETNEKSTRAYLKETTSLLSELSEDVKKINKSLENKKTDECINSANINKENDTHADELDEKNPSVMNTAKSNLRSWYPKTEFTLLDISSVQNVELKNCPLEVDREVSINKIECAFSRKIETKTIETKHIFRRQPSTKCFKSSSDTATYTKTKKLPKVNSVPDSIPSLMQTPIVPAVQPLLKTPVMRTPIPARMVIRNKIVAENPTQMSNDFQHVRRETPIVKIPVPINKPLTHTSVSSTEPVKMISPRTVDPCSFNKYRPTLPSPNKKFSFNNKKNRYKINNLRNPSKYVVRKATFKINKSKMKLNKTQKSRYSVNHINDNYSKVNPKEFIISLNEEDSSKEEDYKENIFENVHQNQNRISSSTSKSAPDNGIPSRVKDEPMHVSEDLGEDTTSPELPSTTTAELISSVKEESFIGVIDTDPSPILDDNTETPEDKNIQNEEVTSVNSETSEVIPPPSEPQKSPVKKETDLLHEAEENLIEIRSKLLSSLDELDTSIKQNSVEKQKLIDMVKQLNALKAAITRTEDKIKTQKMKLVMSNSFVRSLLEGFTLRSKTCSKLKDLCVVAGKKIIGPQYKPPDTLEAQIEDKRKTVDFAKYVQKPTDKK